MPSNLILLLEEIKHVWATTGLHFLAFAVFFLIISRGNKCNPELRYWKKSNILVDAGYWLLVPLFGKYVKLLFMFIAAQYVLGLHTSEEQAAYFNEGFGPLTSLPIWLQALLILIISDFFLYWIHRLFHQKALWRFHSIHHSSKDLDWASTQRFHPINIWLAFTLVDVLMLMLGFAPEAFVLLAPFNVFFSAFVHANLNWKLGPLGYVLTSPVFHRWHHTGVDEGGSKNFAPTFPVLDMMFGTYYMPKDKLPEHYGVDDVNFPVNHFVDQLFYPFKKPKSGD